MAVLPPGGWGTALAGTCPYFVVRSRSGCRVVVRTLTPGCDVSDHGPEDRRELVRRGVSQRRTGSSTCGARRQRVVELLDDALGERVGVARGHQTPGPGPRRGEDLRRAPP